MNYIEIGKKHGEQIFNAILDLIKNATFDKTFQAQVVSQESAGKYRIIHKGRHYPVKSDYKLNIGDWCWVCVPQNNWDSLFVLSSTSVGKTINSLENYEFRADGLYLNGVKITK